MGESELIGIIRDVNAQYAVLFSELLTINFAMIVAIYYFLHRAAIVFRAAAFIFYAIGMFSLIGLMIEQSNFKSEALIALAALPPAQRSQMGDSILAFSGSWVSHTTTFFLSISLWVMFVACAYLLFWWRGDPERHGRAFVAPGSPQPQDG